MIEMLAFGLGSFITNPEEFFHQVSRETIVCIVDVKVASSNAVGVLWEGDVVRSIRGGCLRRIKYLSEYPIAVGRRHLVIAYACEDTDGETLACDSKLQRRAYELNAHGDLLIRDVQNSLMLRVKPTYEEIEICFNDACHAAYTEAYFKMADVLEALGIPQEK